MDASFSVLVPHGPQAQTIARLTWWFFTICGAVYVLVMAALFWALFRRRTPEDDSPATTKRVGQTVGLAVAATVFILCGLTVATVMAGRGLTAPSGPGLVTIDVIGHQWWWEFEYHDQTPAETVNSPNELHIPVGYPVLLKAQSRDVIHSFWVPNLQGKRDLIPGMVTHTWIQADTPGVYRGQCSEFCGHQHAQMAFMVVAEPLNEFREWLAGQRQAATAAASDDAQRGEQLFQGRQCVMCHTVRGTIAGSRVGPDLTHLASRRTIAAGTLPTTSEYLYAWIQDPQRIKPGSRMPPAGMTRDELNDLVAYLETLQ